MPPLLAQEAEVGAVIGGCDDPVGHPLAHLAGQIALVKGVREHGGFGAERVFQQRDIPDVPVAQQFDLGLGPGRHADEQGGQVVLVLF